MSEKKNKSSVRFSIFGTIVALLTLAGFVWYGMTYDYFVSYGIVPEVEGNALIFNLDGD